MIRRTALALALVLSMLCGSAAAQIIYVGSATIEENIIPEAAKAFTAKTGIALSRIETQGPGIGLEMVLRGEAQIAGITHSLTPEEKGSTSTTGSSATTLLASMCIRPIR